MRVCEAWNDGGGRRGKVISGAMEKREGVSVMWWAKRDGMYGGVKYWCLWSGMVDEREKRE